MRPSPGRLEDWTLDGSGAWETRDGMLVLARAGTPAGAIRRPAALALLDTPPLQRVALEAEIRSTAPVGVVYRDLQLVFGYQSSTRFYYVHLAGVTDAVHNGIFLVNDADRRRIDAGTASPQLRDQGWHRVRLERDGATGRIAVYVDGSPTPVLEATDTTLRSGRVGFGSFDDTGEIRSVSVTGSAR